MEKTTSSLKDNGFEPIIVDTKEEALAKIKELIPAGASVMNGSSVTLGQIGFVDYLKAGQHGWKNLHADILAEKDEAKQDVLRRQSVLSDFYLGSVHALTENGELVIASNTGSQMPHIVFTSPNLIFVVGQQKIVADIEAGMKRIKDYIFPLEDARINKLYGGHTLWSKTLIYNKERPASGRTIRVIIVKEILGF